MTDSSYFILQPSHYSAMLLYSLPDPADDESWLFGRRFLRLPTTPVVATIQEGYEHAEQLAYFGTPPIMSSAFAAALGEAGVDNLDLYDAVLRSEDGRIVYEGYKAFNVVGLVAAADLGKSLLDPDVPSRFFDASFSSLSLDEQKPMGALMFRLAEYLGAVVVHAVVKERLEQVGFPNLSFLEPSQFVS